jgi:hypothetical protein
MDDTGDIVAVEMSEDAVKAFRKMHLDQLLYTMVSNQTLKGVIRSTKVNDCERCTPLLLEEDNQKNNRKR